MLRRKSASICPNPGYTTKSLFYNAFCAVRQTKNNVCHEINESNNKGYPFVAYMDGSSSVWI